MEHIKDFIIALFNIDVDGVSQFKYDAAISRAKEAGKKLDILKVNNALLMDNEAFYKKEIATLRQNEKTLMSENLGMSKDLKTIAEKCGEWGSMA